MRFAHEPEFSQRSIHDVQRAVLSGVVFQTRFAASLRISPAFPATFAAAQESAPLGSKSARPSVRSANAIVYLSRRAFRANASRTARSHCLSLELDHDPSAGF